MGICCNQRNRQKSCPIFSYGNLNSTPTSLQVTPDPQFLLIWRIPSLKQTKCLTWTDTVDGSEIQREKQLRLVVYPSIYTGFWHHPNGGWPWDFWTIHSFTMLGAFFSNIYQFCRKSITCQTSCKSSWTCRLSPRVVLSFWGGFPVFWRSVLKGWLRMLGRTINQMVQKGETMKGYHQPWHYVDLLRPYLYQRVTFLRGK